MSIRIFTHQKPDLDACLAAAAAQMFHPKGSSAKILFVPASWDGAGMRENDLALDLDAGGHGMKGRRDPNGTVHSSLELVVQTWASPEDQKALSWVVQFVDAQDVSGNAVRHLVPSMDRSAADVLYRSSLAEIVRGIQADRQDDMATYEFVRGIFRALLMRGRQYAEAEGIADQAERFGYRMPGCTVALVRTDDPLVSDVLFDRQVRAVVYADGNNMGIRGNRFYGPCVDVPVLREFVEQAGETIGPGGDTWFMHSAGRLFCRGSCEAPASSPSRVDPRAFAQAFASWHCRGMTEKI